MAPVWDFIESLPSASPWTSARGASPATQGRPSEAIRSFGEQVSTHQQNRLCVCLEHWGAVVCIPFRWNGAARGFPVPENERAVSDGNKVDASNQSAFDIQPQCSSRRRQPRVPFRAVPSRVSAEAGDADHGPEVERTDGERSRGRLIIQ